MAEVILPGEEENNVPVVPEIVMEMPGANSKVIKVSFDPLNTRKTTVVNTSEAFFTTDTDAWLEFTVTGLTDATGTYSLVLRNRDDGSTFQRVGNTVDGKAYYKIPEQEIRHAGRWIGQMYVTLENGQTTAAQFSFRVDGHILDGKDVRETVVEDFQTLMAQLQGVKGQAEIDLADLKADLSLSTVEAEQLIADTQELKLIYDELLETGVLQTNINEKLTELETTYAPRLATNEQSVVSLTAQLQQTEQDLTAQLADKAEKTQADSLQMQVNNIVLQGTSGDSSAEVAQAKVDMYGNNFTTVKDHLDSTEQSLSGSVDKKYQYLWQIGALSSGNLVVNQNRLVTKDIQVALDDLIVSTTDFSVYRFAICLYSDSSGSNPVDKGWQYADFTIKKGSYFRIVGARISEIAISNVREGIFNNLSISSTSTLNNIKKLVDSQNYEIYAFGSDELELGNINDGNNQTTDYRVRTKKRIDVYKDTIIKIDVSNTLYVFAVVIYNKDTKLHELTTDWITPPSTYKVPYNCQIRIRAFRSDNAIMTNEDILALNKNIKVQLTQQSTHFYATDFKIENTLKEPIAIDFEIGTLNGSGYNGLSTARARSRGYLFVKNGITINLDNPAINYAFLGYDENFVKTFDSGWMSNKVYTVNKDSYHFCRLVCKYVSGADITTLNDFESAIYLSENFKGIDRFESVIRSEPIHNECFELIAHRGFHDQVPENTIHAIKETFRKGYRTIENDISVTSDGEYVILHDSTINRTARNADGSVIVGDININDITLAQALTYDFGIFMGSQYADTKIMTLKEYIFECKRYGLRVALDLKVWDLSAILDIYNICNRLGMLKHVYWHAYTIEQINYILSLNKHSKVLLGGGDLPPSTDPIVGQLVALKTDYNTLGFTCNTATEANVADILDNGLEVNIYTVNNHDTVIMYMGYGVNAVGTDFILNSELTMI
ncbi:glycerophosphodiester phosphodiesterase family protein [Jeotgalibaca porci]|uniref:glycerophosphodiester phosphodiesterase family protein n=1 Tax=Jeotgalibaca porci TaxID=1868793 RepID=UPI0035A124DB